MTIDYRPLHTVEELEQVVNLEIAVWGLDPRDAVPMNLMRPISAHGGLVLGAFEGETMVGMSLAFPARVDGKWVLWSHMTAVARDHQRRGIGFGLKQAQRQWALAHGYNEIRWTFDPFQPGNANFNLRQLGASANTYLVEYYGVMRDAINGSIAPDRIEAVWKLKDRRVAALAEGANAVAFRGQPAPEAFMLTRDAEGNPLLRQDYDRDGKWRFIQIPESTAGLSRERARAWRQALRSALRDSFAQGYVAVDFVRSGDRAFYALRRSPIWFLYVLRCGDDSLYTGITPNVEARLRKHQAGRGAAYTASRRPVSLLGVWQYPDRRTALKAELAFKKLPRASKLAQIESRQPFLQGHWVEG